MKTRFAEHSLKPYVERFYHNWSEIHECSSCKTTASHMTFCCPACGATEGTITVIGRWWSYPPNNPWWRFWTPGVWEIKCS